jgi:hypothetical protein
MQTLKTMKLLVASLLYILTSQLFAATPYFQGISGAQLFTIKTTNVWFEADAGGNAQTPVYHSNNEFKVYVNWNNKNAYVIAKEKLSGESYRINGTIYSNTVLGKKVYYLQSENGLSKVSFTKEENGIAFYSYSDRTLTVFANQ